jgi:hypothetical protein
MVLQEGNTRVSGKYSGRRNGAREAKKEMILKKRKNAEIGK